MIKIWRSSIIYVLINENLSIGMPYYQGGYNISRFDITKSAHSYPMWEKSERNTWEQKIYLDRSDRSIRPVWPVGVQRLVILNWPVWGTGLTLTEKRLVFERGVFIPHTLTHSWVLMPLHFRAIPEPWEHLRSPSQPLFVRFEWIKIRSLSWVEWNLC